MFDSMIIILAVLSVAYICYIVGEKYYYAAKRKKLKLVIHVNGIRGKSTTTRLIDAGLRGCGYKVFSKTTGTVPTTIDVNGVVSPVRRLGPANVREQMRVVGWAVKSGADALVVECMAVKPELQYLTEHRILHSDVCVITNVRADHLDEMGDNLESIAYSLANVAPERGVLILGEDKFKDCFKKCVEKVHGTLVVAKSYTGDELLETFPENIAAALAVCDELKLDREKFFNGMRSYVHDMGAIAKFTVGDTIFVNGFSINDPESTLRVYDEVLKKYSYGDVCVLLNVRADRPFRINQHIEMLAKMKFKRLLLTGSNVSYVLKKLSALGIAANEVKDVKELLSEKVVFGCGNIAADGMAILNYFKENGEEAAF